MVIRIFHGGYCRSGVSTLYAKGVTEITLSIYDANQGKGDTYLSIRFFLLLPI